MDLEEIEYFKKLGIDFIEVIAHGGYGTVYYVYSHQYKSNFALKSIPIELFNESELDCLKTIDDPRIVSLYQYYKFDENVYMLMEYCPNDLDKMIKQDKIKGDKYLQRLLYDVIIAVKACHDKNIAHCDIKPSNFLIDQYGRVKISDFGLSSIFKCSPKSTMFRGTIYYMAPEILQCKEYNPMISDIWALGISIYMIVTGCYPFYHEDDLKLAQIIMRGIYDEDDIKDPMLKHLIARCLTVNPAKRATLKELLDSPYFSKLRQEKNQTDVPISLSHIAIKPRFLIVKPKVQERNSLLCFQTSHSLMSLRGSRVHLNNQTSKSSEFFEECGKR